MMSRICFKIVQQKKEDEWRIDVVNVANTGNC